mgnify:CR=1 FL=1
MLRHGSARRCAARLSFQTHPGAAPPCAPLRRSQMQQHRHAHSTCTFFFFIEDPSMNCSTTLLAFEDAFRHVDEHMSTNNAVMGASLIAISLPLLLYGYKTFLPVVSLLAGLVVSWLIVQTTTSVDCPVRVVMLLVSVITAIVLCVCLLRKMLFLLGAGAFAATTHFVYEALPWTSSEASGRSVYYWGATAAASLVGAAVVCCRQKDTLILATAMIGACALSSGVYVLTMPPAWVLALLIVPVSTASVYVQHSLRTKANAKKSRSNGATQS